MTSTCYASTRGNVMRVTKLNQCCAAITDACAQVVSDGFISVKITPNVESAQEILLKNAADAICVYDPGCDSLKDMGVVITLCRINPEMLNIMTGQSLVLDSANAVGTRIKTGGLGCLNRFAIEVWGNVPGTPCAGVTPAPQYSYFLVPCLRSARITGDITIDGASAVSLEITAKTAPNPLWGSGPATTGPAGGYFVAGTAAVPTGLTTPIGATDVVHMQVTPVAPPVVPAACGCTSITFA